MTPTEIMTKLIARANEGVTVEGQHIQSANIVLVSGVLYCSLQYRGSNSRGANRGRGHSVRFNYRTHDQQYSKGITKARAIEILEEEGK